MRLLNILARMLVSTLRASDWRPHIEALIAEEDRDDRFVRDMVTRQKEDFVRRMSAGKAAKRAST
jgi:hypothetical protein